LQRERVLAARLETAELDLESCREREKALIGRLDFLNHAWIDLSSHSCDSRVQILTHELERVRQAGQAKSEWEMSAAREIERLQGELNAVRRVRVVGATDTSRADRDELLLLLEHKENELNSAQEQAFTREVELARQQVELDKTKQAVVRLEEELQQLKKDHLAGAQKLQMTETARLEALGQLMLTEKAMQDSRKPGAAFTSRLEQALDGNAMQPGSPQLTSRLDTIRLRIDQLQDNTNQTRLAQNVPDDAMQLTPPRKVNIQQLSPEKGNEWKQLTPKQFHEASELKQQLMPSPGDELELEVDIAVPSQGVLEPVLAECAQLHEAVQTAKAQLEARSDVEVETEIELL